MRIEADAVIPFPRSTVYRAYRDELPSLVAHLPNVDRIETEDRQETDDHTVRLVNVWHGGGDIPAALRRFLDGSLLVWRDFATWDQSAWTAEWRIENHSFGEAVRCTGRNRFIEIAADRTRLEIEGQMNIDLKRVGEISAPLAGALDRSLEQFIVKLITANLISISDGLTEYLKARH